MPYLRGSQPLRIWGLFDMVSRAACARCPESGPRGPRGQANFANKLPRHRTQKKMGMQKRKFARKKRKKKPTPCLETLHKAYKGQISITARKCFRNPRNPSNDHTSSPWISRERINPAAAPAGRAPAHPHMPPLCLPPKASSTFALTLWKNVNVYLIYTTGMSGFIVFS